MKVSPSQSCCKSNFDTFAHEVPVQEVQAVKPPSSEQTSPEFNKPPSDCASPRLNEAARDSHLALSIIRESSANTYDAYGQNDLRSYLDKLDKVAHASPQLQLEVISSSCLPKNTTLLVMPHGYELGLRGAKDGVTYFGCKKRLKALGAGKGVIANDFLIPTKEPDLVDKYRGRHFHIKFNPDRLSYYLKDLGIGFGVFVKTSEALQLKDNQLFQIGSSFIVVGLIQMPGVKHPRLRLKTFGGPCSGEVFYFNAAEFVEQKITIGRMHDCDVQIQDNLLSKKQTSLVFSITDGWLLVDGDIETRRPSTNGTW